LPDDPPPPHVVPAFWAQAPQTLPEQVSVPATVPPPEQEKVQDRVWPLEQVLGAGATRGREDARAPLATAAHPRTYRRDPTGAALVGAVLADAILAGTAARARSAGGRDARGDAPLAHDRAGDGAARAGRGAGVAGAGAGGRRGRTGETIAVAHPVTVTLPAVRTGRWGTRHTTGCR
jgi:hypothetical protein